MVKVYMVSLEISETSGKKYLRVEDNKLGDEIRLVPPKITLTDIRNASCFESYERALSMMNMFAEIRKNITALYTFAIEEKYIALTNVQEKSRIWIG